MLFRSKYDTGWSPVGVEGFSAGRAMFPCLVFSDIHQPNLAFADWSAGARASVARFNGTDWVPVGNPGFSPGTAMYTSLAFGPDHRQYVAFRDGANGFKATVMAYNGASWNLLGPAGFSDGRADYTNLVFSYSGTPIVSYEDFNVGGKTTVKQFVVNTGIVDNKETSSLNIFPNPASDRVFINLKNVDGTARNIQVFDLTGKKIADFISHDSEAMINVEGYPSGLYFVKVITDQSNLTGKFFRK